jgi:hypothetical protein
LVAEDAKPSLLDIARSKSGRPGPRCKLATLTTEHPKAAEIRELLAAVPSEIQYSTAHEVFKDAGIELSADSISRHCRKRCSCLS